MDKILLKQEEIKTLMGTLEGIEQGSPEFKTALDNVEAKQAELVSIQADAKRFAEMQESLSSFKKPVTVQAGPVLGSASIVGSGFAEDPKKGFQSAGELLGLIAKNTAGKHLNLQADERLAHLSEISMTAGTGNTVADGIVIPAEIDPTVNVLGLDASDDWFSRFNIVQTSSNAKTIYRSAATTNGGTVGLTVGRAAELAALVSSKQVFEKTTIGVDKLYVYAKVSEEDLSDIPWLESNIISAAPRLMDIKKGEEVLFGDGVEKALGFTNGADIVDITRAGAGNVVAADIVKMKARHLRTRGVSSFWMVNQSVWEQLPLMTIGDQPVFVQDLSGNTDGFLLGMPVYTTEDCELLGQVGDVLLVNPTAYCGLEKAGGTKFASSMHVSFDTDEMAFRWTSRFGGAPLFNSVYTPRNNNGGSAKATLSNFVRLGSA